MDNELFSEALEIKNLISNTPCISKEGVQQYHSKIIERLDSGKYIEVPGQMHRNLHQEMWIKGHQIYDGFSDETEAGLDFVINGEIRKEFNEWYLFEHVFSQKNLSWRLELAKQVTIDLIKSRVHPLEKLINDDLKI